MAKQKASEFLDSLGLVSRCLRVVANEAYASLEVGSTQAKFLRHIGRRSRISQAELARATATDPALTGRALETLIARGWVKRTKSATDRRQYVLELSAAGERARKRVEDMREQIAKRVVAALEERDLADFERVAKKIVGVLAPAGVDVE